MMKMLKCPVNQFVILFYVSFFSTHQIYAQGCLFDPFLQSFQPFTIDEEVLGISTARLLDLDQDGDMDILTNAYWENQVIWYENEGDLEFSRRIISDQREGPISVFAIDMDGDADVDVLSASVLDNTIAWYENEGGGIYKDHIISTADSGARDVFAVDLDGDLDMDVLSASISSGRIIWYENVGFEKFEERLISIEVENAKDITAADIDGDGDMDIVATSDPSFRDELLLFENNGDQSFDRIVISDRISKPEEVFITDLDQDGKLDIIANATDRLENSQGFFISGLYWYRQTDSLTFERWLLGRGLSDLRSVGIQDLDRDGDQDVLVSVIEEVSDEEVVNLIWYENLGEGDFSARIPIAELEESLQVLANDMDGDGDMDIISTSFSSLELFESVEKKILVENILIETELSPSDFDLADFNKDGRLDIAMVTRESSGPGGRVTWYQNVGNSYIKQTLEEGVFFPDAMKANDVNMDGLEDIVTTFRPSFNQSSQLYYFQNEGSNSFSSPLLVGRTPATNGVEVIDMDNDGDNDIVVGEVTSVKWFENTSSGFVSHIIVEKSRDLTIGVGDFDEDGDIDIIHTRWQGLNDPGELYLQRNKGDQTFEEILLLSLPVGESQNEAFRGIQTGDLDGDGDTDFTVGTTERLFIFLWEGSMYSYYFLEPDAGVPIMKLADRENDGDLDILKANGFKEGISWFVNDGSGGFTEDLESNIPFRVSGIFPTDVDGDGLKDVISYNFTDQTINSYTQNNDIDKDGLPNGTDNCSFAVNTSLDFDGENDVIGITNSLGIPISNSPYTIEVWFLANAMGDKGLVGWGNYGATNQVNALRLSSTGFRHYWWGNDLDATTGDLTGEWHHVAATFDGVQRSIYLDGELLVQDQPINHNVPTADNFAIGRTFNQEFFDGNIDEVRIWNLARTQEQIQAVYQQEIDPETEGLVAYFRLNEGRPGLDNRNVNAALDFASEVNEGVLIEFDAMGCRSNWKIGAPIQLADLNQNGVGDVCELVTEVNPNQERGIEPHLISVFPNPVTTQMSIRYYLPKQDKLRMELVDIHGRVLINESRTASRGEHQCEFSLQDIPSGIYFFKTSLSSGGQFNKTIIKQ